MGLWSGDAQNGTSMTPELRRRVYLWIGSVGLVLCSVFSVTGWASTWETRFAFPVLTAYFVVVLAVLIRRPCALGVVERAGFWVLAFVWLAGMAIGLATVADDEAAWQSLSPGVFMNMVMLVVLAYLWYGTQWALMASLVVPVASTAIGVTRFWGSADYLGRLLQYEGYVVVIAAFTYLLARSRDSVLTTEIEAQRMRILAFEDSLTGLPNRRSVAERLGTLLADESSSPLSVISFDLDDFKQINDTFGHDAGDRVLRDVADIAAEHVPHPATLGRWGGEEFLVLLPGVDVGEALNIAEVLRLELAAYDDDGIQVTASFGVSQATPTATVGAVLRTVDELMYRAKRSGRNTVEAAPMISTVPLLHEVELVPEAG